MKKNSDLNPIEKSQIIAYLQNFNADESIPIFPICTWDKISDVELTLTTFKKCINKLAELGYGTFEASSGSVTFILTETGREWIEGGI